MTFFWASATEGAGTSSCVLPACTHVMMTCPTICPQQPQLLVQVEATLATESSRFLSVPVQFKRQDCGAACVTSRACDTRQQFWFSYLAYIS